MILKRIVYPSPKPSTPYNKGRGPMYPIIRTLYGDMQDSIVGPLGNGSCSDERIGIIRELQQQRHYEQMKSKGLNPAPQNLNTKLQTPDPELL